ncbi:hypothetical protein HYS84_03735 [Candidatus Saccharibacteria bacterium]|nr:hypothetical protein [Candidatus Saccharibacteria bacterium]
MVEKIKTILKELKKANKPVSLLAILKMDDVTDRWSVVYSASDLQDAKKRNAMFRHLVDLLIKYLSKAELQEIARVGVFPLDNHLVQNLMKYKKGYSFQEPTPINGNVVHEGHILESSDTEKIPQLL